MDTIKELFYGNIHPFERDVPKDSEGDKLAKLTIRHENALRATLNESEAEILEKYKDAMTELGYMVVRDVESTVKIHISEISFLIVGSTSVSLYRKHVFFRC